MDNTDNIFNIELDFVRGNSLDGVRLGILLKRIGRKLFKCEQCGTTKTTEQYEYKNAKYIPDYNPKHWKALCKKCTKRECGKRVFDRFTLGE